MPGPFSEWHNDLYVDDDKSKTLIGFVVEHKFYEDFKTKSDMDTNITSLQLMMAGHFKTQDQAD